MPLFTSLDSDPPDALSNETVCRPSWELAQIMATIISSGLEPRSTAGAWASHSVPFDSIEHAHATRNRSCINQHTMHPPRFKMITSVADSVWDGKPVFQLQYHGQASHVVWSIFDRCSTVQTSGVALCFLTIYSVCANKNRLDTLRTTSWAGRACATRCGRSSQGSTWVRDGRMHVCMCWNWGWPTRLRSRSTHTTKSIKQ